MLSKRAVIASIAMLATAFWLSPASPARAEDDPNQEVLTNGPVHEAFAAPAVANPTPSLVVPKEPPAPIEEMPPDVKPDGANVVWVSGYWAWDDTRNNFIWVSGIWRDTPPNYVWVAGYWNQVADGFQWTPGFWSPEQQEQVNYLPEPPQTVETGPTTPQADPNTFWVPGNWQYNETRYVWRPGYWTVARPDWIWTPAHYVWTPSGFLFIPGHWDYVLERRGVLFAPVFFAGPVFHRPHFVFAPTVVIDSGLLTVNFFVRPHYYHYYFGDCYGESYARLGYSPWFSVGVRFGPDPLFTYYRWHNRDDRRWNDGIREHYAFMNSHPEARPPRTYIQQTTIINNNITINKNSNNKQIAIGAPLNQYVKNVSTGPNNAKFVNVSNQQRQVIAQQGIKTQEFSRERAKVEAGGIAKTGPGRTGPDLTGGPKNIGADTGKPKSLNLQTLAQSSGGQLPGTTPADQRDRRGPKTGDTIKGGNNVGVGPGTVGPKTGDAIKTGPSGIGRDTGPKTGDSIKGPVTGPGTIGPKTGDAIKTGPSGIGRDTGPKTGDSIKTGPMGSGRDTGPKTGDTIKGGSSGPGRDSGRPKSTDKGGAGPGAGPKLPDASKGAGAIDPSKGSLIPSGGKPSGSQSNPPDRGKGSGDPRKKTDDKNANNPRGTRAFYPPDNGGIVTDENAQPTDNAPRLPSKDPVRPLTLDPNVSSQIRSTGIKPGNESRETQLPVRIKDPVGPLTVAPQPAPPRSTSTPPPTNTPGLRSNAEPKTKDPVGPLRVGP